MKDKKGISVLWKKIDSIDWKLLVFLILFLNVKLFIKVAAILLIYTLRPNFKFGFRSKNSRLPLFYLLVIGIAIFNWLITRLLTNFNYGLVLFTGLSFWGLCILVIHQIKLSVEKNDPEMVHRTIIVFFIMNAIVSLIVYLGIIIETDHINPYRYQGNFQKYFSNTGDHIKGITFDLSTTNAVLNGFGILYFLFRKKIIMALLCMLVFLLTGSNVINLLLCTVLLFIFFFQNDKEKKSMIIICLLMLVIFWAKISPQNGTYVAKALEKPFGKRQTMVVKDEPFIPIVERPDSLLSEREKKQKVALLFLDSINNAALENANDSMLITFTRKPTIPEDSIHTASFQYKDDTSANKKSLIRFIEEHPVVPAMGISKGRWLSIPGKVITFWQTVNYFKQHPLKIITGAGMGNFSSKLAFRAASMKFAGGYPARFVYINNDFRANHLDLYLFYFTNKDEYHSIINSPNSTYDQLASEYGLAGLFSFAFFYIGFFVRHIKKITYVVPLLLFMLGSFFVEYWFEQLSVVVVFELLLLLHIKETTTNNINQNERP